MCGEVGPAAGSSKGASCSGARRAHPTFVAPVVVNGPVFVAFHSANASAKRVAFCCTDSVVSLPLTAHVALKTGWSDALPPTLGRSNNVGSPSLRSMVALPTPECCKIDGVPIAPAERIISLRAVTVEGGAGAVFSQFVLRKDSQHYQMDPGRIPLHGRRHRQWTCRQAAATPGNSAEYADSAAAGSAATGTPLRHYSARRPQSSLGAILAMRIQFGAASW
jgi:hypothetical protein